MSAEESHPGIKPYRDELQQRFNHFLLSKYGSRKNLKQVWGEALEDDEDPVQNSVRFPEGSFYQEINDPMGEWTGIKSPARYAEFMEFGIEVSRRYYKEMMDYVRSLGSKVPLTTSNLLSGAADVYSHADGDIMSNHAYFNHPLLPVDGNKMIVPGMREYVTSNPLTIHNDGIYMRADLLTMSCPAVIADKPFVVSEWNEYGVYPFHSTAFMALTAYACLNDWDGLMLYCHHTSESSDNQPSDEVDTIFDFYNDASLICQFGFMQAVFQKGLIQPAKSRSDLVFTKQDLLSLPPAAKMMYSYLPFVTGLRNVFPEDEKYKGNADVAVTAGFFNGGDLSQAKHGIYYSLSPYRDPFRKILDHNRLKTLPQKKDFVFEDINILISDGDYTTALMQVDKKMKEWGVIPTDCGIVNNALISDTGEIKFDPIAGFFLVKTENCFYYSGKPSDIIKITEEVSLKVTNDRITVAALPLDEVSLSGSKQILLTMIGATGMDESVYLQEGFMTMVEMKGKLYADMAEGEMSIAENFMITPLDLYGNRIEKAAKLDGTALHFLLERK